MRAELLPNLGVSLSCRSRLPLASSKHRTNSDESALELHSRLLEALKVLPC